MLEDEVRSVNEIRIELACRFALNDIFLLKSLHINTEIKMRITTKGRYALRAVLSLAGSSPDGKPVSIKTIAQKEGISAEFLEQIFFRLRRAGVIESVRGPGGGFYFSRPLDGITLMDILEASGEGLGIVPCSCGKKKTCGKKEACLAGGIWTGLDEALRNFAQAKTIADMLIEA
jgi:Rrf2 family iron-sulfur cluster assembly transcriptional regulator